jgi:outer membrane protein assembly factor BamB
VWKATSQDASYASAIAATVDGVRHAFFFTRDGLVALDPATGKIRASNRWRSRIVASVNAATPVLLDGRYLFLSSSYATGGILLDVKKDAVEEVWKNDKSLSSHFCTPVAVGGQLFGFHGRQEGDGADLHCIDWKTGKVRWTESGLKYGSLLAAGKKLLLLTQGGELILADASAERFTVKARASVLGDGCRAHLALAGGLLYGRDGGKLVCWKVSR